MAGEKSIARVSGLVATRPRMLMGTLSGDKSPIDSG